MNCRAQLSASLITLLGAAGSFGGDLLPGRLNDAELREQGYLPLAASTSLEEWNTAVEALLAEMERHGELEETG